MAYEVIMTYHLHMLSLFLEHLLNIHRQSEYQNESHASLTASL